MAQQDSDQPVEQFRREFDKDELTIEGERDPFPPTRYDR